MCPRRIIRATSLAAVLLPACSAVAAPPVPVVDGWAGPYIGAYFTVAGGRAHEATDQVQLSTSLTRQAHGEYSGPVTGATVDLFAGRNWQFGNFVVGGQAEATIASDVDLNVTGTVRAMDIDTNGPSTNISTQTRANRNQLRFSAGLVGRAGFLARPDLLLYGLAGVEFGHFIFNDGDDQFGSANRSLAAGHTAGSGRRGRQPCSARAERPLPAPPRRRAGAVRAPAAWSGRA